MFLQSICVLITYAFDSYMTIIICWPSAALVRYDNNKCKDKHYDLLGFVLIYVYMDIAQERFQTWDL